MRSVCETSLRASEIQSSDGGRRAPFRPRSEFRRHGFGGQPNEVDPKTKPADQERAENKNMGTIDEESDDDEDYQVPEADIEVPNVLDQTMNQNP